MNRRPLLLEPALYPLALVYRAVMRGRNLAFDRGWLKAKKVAKPVISIGNLTAGGTGKTPLTALLIEGFRARAKKVGLISRGYGGTEKGPARVPSDGTTRSAERFGDETTWLAHMYPEVPVAIGADRAKAAEFLLSRNQLDLLLADDAFQHRWLSRAMDVVVLDPTEPRWHYRSLPLGREREGFVALARAKAIFITKTNLAENASLAWLRGQIGKLAKERRLTPMVFELEARIAYFMPLGQAKSPASVERRPLQEFQGKRVLLVSGIGRPHTFARLVRDDARAEVLEHLVFSDHHAYSNQDFRSIEARAVQLGADAILMTEKDAVKMADWQSRIPCWVSRLETRARSDLGAFYDAVDRLLL